MGILKKVKGLLFKKNEEIIDKCSVCGRDMNGVSCSGCGFIPYLCDCKMIGEEAKEEVKEGRDFIYDTCPICNKVIGYEKYALKSKVFYHKKCFRKAKRDAQKDMGISP